MTWYFRSAVLAGLVVVLLAGVPTTVVDAATTVLPTKTSTTTERLSDQMAPPTGYSASQMIFDDQFSGTSLNSSNWSPQLGDEDSTWDDGGKIAAPFSGPSTPVTKEEAMFGPSQVSRRQRVDARGEAEHELTGLEHLSVDQRCGDHRRQVQPCRRAGWYVSRCTRRRCPTPVPGHVAGHLVPACGRRAPPTTTSSTGTRVGAPGSTDARIEVVHSASFADQGQQGSGQQRHDVGCDVAPRASTRLRASSGCRAQSITDLLSTARRCGS